MLRQGHNTGKSRKEGERKTILYGSYEIVKGIPTVHAVPAFPDATTSWQIPSNGKDTKNPESSKMESEYLAAVEAGDMAKAQELVNKAAETKTAPLLSFRAPAKEALLHRPSPPEGIDRLKPIAVFDRSSLPSQAMGPSRS